MWYGAQMYKVTLLHRLAPKCLKQTVSAGPVVRKFEQGVRNVPHLYRPTVPPF